ncbi:general transcription factor 3C polypeptide 2 [Pholidichthys leucotaenia]
MESIDSGQGQEKPAEESLDLIPSWKGRERKKNSKYFDYETEETYSPKKSPRKQSAGKGAASKKSPTKDGKVKTENDKEELADETKLECDGQAPAEPPKKRGRPRKTQGKGTTTKSKITGEGVAEGAAQLENETPKPKRKYVKRKVVEHVQPVEEPQGEKDPGESEEKTELGGRRRRGAAKAALKYLHTLAKEVFGHAAEEPDSQPGAGDEDAVSEKQTPKVGKGGRGRKRKHRDSEAAEDEDFIPDIEGEEADEMEDEEEEEDTEMDLDFDLKTPIRRSSGFNRVLIRNNHGRPCGRSHNGLSGAIMQNIFDSTDMTKKFRDEHFTSWLFPNWIPSSSDWVPVPQSDVENYLPQERHSAAFRVLREGHLREETPLQRLNRFEGVAAHSERWDMLLFTGGPVRAMEWCPTPDGAPANQYVALACHRGMDDTHYLNKTFTGSGLVQLWDVGKLEYEKRPESKPALVYGLAQDKGFIWKLKWCPIGGWELPNSSRKAPFLPRLGLLAVASSNCVVTIYSLPHPDALHANNTLTTSEASENPPVYKAKAVVTLKLGAFKAPRQEQSGMVLSLDWHPENPCTIMAIGFYDGTVGLWNLLTKSPLLRVRESDRSLSLLPYRCFLAHNNAVQTLNFCPATSHLLVTSGDDRIVKTWDLRRLYEPVTAQKRSRVNEICWPLTAPGFIVGEDTTFVGGGSQAVRYIDHGMNSLLPIPRNTTVWSLSYSEWTNSLVTSDDYGEVILSVLPSICTFGPYVKRFLDRRFPIYFTSMMPFDETEEGSQETGGVTEENTVGQQNGGGTEGPEASTGQENGNDDVQGKVRNGQFPPPQGQTYKEAVKKFWLEYRDYDVRSFLESEQRALWKRMKNTEYNLKLNFDDMTLAALYKVRFNSNVSCHAWLASGGQSGLVRLNCVRGLTNPDIRKIVSKSRAQFNTRFSPQNQEETVQMGTEPL